MQILKKESAPRYIRDQGIVGHLLASPRTCEAKHLATSLVEIKPGGEQRIHSHTPEQVYFVLEGHGRMTVGDETAIVGPGDCVFVPSRVAHGLRNDGQTLLRYLGVVSPAFSLEELQEFWPCKSEGEAESRNEGLS